MKIQNFVVNLISQSVKSNPASYEYILLKSKSKCPGWPYLYYQIFASEEKIFALAKFCQSKKVK